MFRQEDRRLPVGDQIGENSTFHSRHIATDIIVYGVILSLGALEFGLTLRSNDFFTGDTTYFELARSLVEKGFYGFDFKPETLLPPGFPVILASLCVTLGCTYGVLIRSMAVFGTLGFIASYELFCSLGEQFTGAIICLLLDSSPIIFGFMTRMVFSDLPFFFTSMLVLLLTVRLDTAKNPRGRAVLWLLCGLFIVGSLLIRSSGIALLGGLFAWLAVSRFGKREVHLRRLKTFAPLLVIGLFVEILWIQWGAKHEVLQWPMVGGYPQSYIRQLEMKNGNEPELGKASLGDIPSRIEKNLNDRAVVLMQLLTRKGYINSVWVSPIVLVPVLLILLGLARSVWHGGGGLPEWYFVIHESVYLLWPWNFEIRFFLPVAPLACFYLWRGGKALPGSVSQLRPRAVGAWSFFACIVVTIYAFPLGWRSRTVQPELTASFWVFLAIVSAWIAWTGSYRYPDAFAALVAWTEKRVSIRSRSLTVASVGGLLIVSALLVLGTAQEISMGRENLKFDVTKKPTYPDILAGQWIRANTASTAVVMARQLDVVYHHSRRNVIWFPPVSDPRLLVEGIKKYKVDLIIISDRDYSYWLPREQDSFQFLMKQYPNTFRMIHEERNFRVFRVVPVVS